MKKTMIINLLLAILIGSSISCKKDGIIPPLPKDFNPNTMGDYFVSPTGSDLNPGTFDEPLATWQRAADLAGPGDTVYFRGGIWNVTGSGSVVTFPTDGEDGNPISFYNYPGEMPIIDGSQRNPDDWNTCFNLVKRDYLNFKGITIRNFAQPSSGKNTAGGIGANDCTNLNFENITVHDIGGPGIRHLGAWRHPGYKPYTYPEHEFMKGDTSRFINCDVYNCMDKLGSMPGNMGDGFKVDNERGSYMYFEGCRVWNCSDDGFDISGHVLGVFNNCWAFLIGVQDLEFVNGNGFKLGPGRRYNEQDGTVIRIVTNCIGAFNYSAAFTENNGVSDDPDTPLRMYNNVCYDNDRGFIGNWDHTFDHDQVYKNNIIYKSREVYGKDSYSLTDYIHDHNSWDTQIKITDSSFVSLVPRDLSGTRQEDGSLPEVNFFKLADGSDLKGAGIDVGMSKNPDIGIDWAYLKRRY